MSSVVTKCTKVVSQGTTVYGSQNVTFGAIFEHGKKKQKNTTACGDSNTMLHISHATNLATGVNVSLLSVDASLELLMLLFC